MENKDIYRVLKEYKITKRIEDAFGSLFLVRREMTMKKQRAPCVS
ncbi:hypothetical protein D928_01477 [Enterococcus faecalis 20-SD-BW-06]|nr:hypothetical protein D928_01477 [Enterococcus faecalis 20-SD-BW-06]EPI03075.1 hypothetical protein D919_00583 [Enterococcus faecalis 20-SD-BW-08]